MYRVDYALHYIIQIFLGYVTFALITLVMIAVISPWSILFILPVGFCYYYVFNIIRKPYLSVKNSLKIQDLRLFHICHTLHGLQTIRSYKHQRNSNNNGDLIDYHQRSRWTEVVFNRGFSPNGDPLRFIVFGSSLFLLVLSNELILQYVHWELHIPSRSRIPLIGL